MNTGEAILQRLQQSPAVRQAWDTALSDTCPAHGPLSDDGGCPGCVAEDRATDAWEGN